MRIAFFDTHTFDRTAFEQCNSSLGNPHEITYIEARLTADTAAAAKGYPAICVFVNDRVTSDVIGALAEHGLRIIALRSAGFNHVDLPSCKKHGITVVRVPAYSPYAVAEHALCLLLALNRKIHRAYLRVRELNFSLEGLVGFDIHGKTVGILGTGKIGEAFARIMRGFGCRILAYDITPDERLIAENVVEYCTLSDLYREADIISLHVPLTDTTRHIIDERALSLMKKGVVLINTGRGGLIDTKAMIAALKKGTIGGAGLDVYEEEEGIFFFDLSDKGLQDDTLARLLTFPNVLITAHQAFLTHEALHEIARTTIQNVSLFERGEPLQNQICC
jgi:D-lactate dehydrogenase